MHAVVARSTFGTKNCHAWSTCGSCDVEKVHTLVARSTCGSENAQTPHAQTTLGSGDVEKVHVVVARSTFGSKHVQNTRGSDHFWTSRCRPGVEKVQAIVAVKSAKNCRFQAFFDIPYLRGPPPSGTLRIILYYSGDLRLQKK